MSKPPSLLTLDASHGEGGGQILRTALSLAVALGRPVRLSHIRERRPKPGLQPQHLTAVRALAAVSDAAVSGDALDSTALTFVPGPLRPGTYRFDVGAVRGSAGAVSLVFQALLLPLSRAATPSHLTLIGGTHVPWSPPFPYLSDVFLPLLAEVGVRARVVLHRWGWYPRGGGEVEATIVPGPAARGLMLETSPPGGSLVGFSAVSRLPRSIAERQRRRAEERLATAGLAAHIALVEDATALGPGTCVFLATPGRSGFSALGRRGLPAEAVADTAVDALLAHRASGAALDDHLADQVVPFLALGAAPSTFTCPTLSSHLRTLVWVVDAFLPGRITLEEGMPARVRVFPRHEDSVRPTS